MAVPLLGDVRADGISEGCGQEPVAPLLGELSRVGEHVKGSKTIATVAAASPVDARAHGITEGRSEESIGPFLCELSRIREDDRDLGVAHL